jgi:hypothetical protein
MIGVGVAIGIGIEKVWEVQGSKSIPMPIPIPTPTLFRMKGRHPAKRRRHRGFIEPALVVKLGSEGGTLSQLSSA